MNTSAVQSGVVAVFIYFLQIINNNENIGTYL